MERQRRYDLKKIDNSNSRFTSKRLPSFEIPEIKGSPVPWNELSTFQKTESLVCLFALALSFSSLVPPATHTQDANLPQVPPLPSLASIISNIYQSIDGSVRPSDARVVSAVSHTTGVDLKLGEGLSELAQKEAQKREGASWFEQVGRLALRSAGIVKEGGQYVIYEINSENQTLSKRVISPLEAIKKIGEEVVLTLHDLGLKTPLSASIVSSAFAGGSSSLESSSSNSSLSACSVPLESSSISEKINTKKIVNEAPPLSQVTEQMQGAKSPFNNQGKEGFAAVLLTSAAGDKEVLAADQAFKTLKHFEGQLSKSNYQLIKNNGNDAVFYNVDADAFLKVNLRGETAQTIIENQQVTAGIRLAFPKQNTGDWINLTKLIGLNGEEIPATVSRYLGVTFEYAVNERIVQRSELPAFIRMTLDTVENVARTTNRFNKDLNPRNVLIALDPDTNNFKIIIIDWASSIQLTNGAIPVESFIPAFRKFFGTSTLKLTEIEKQVALSTIVAQMKTLGRSELAKAIEQTMLKDGLKLLLEKVTTKEGLKHVLKAGGKSTMLILLLASLFMTYEDVQAASIESAQLGENFHIDLSDRYNERNSLDPQVCKDAVGDSIGGLPNQDGFQYVKELGISDDLVKTWKDVLAKEQADTKHQLIIKNFLNEGRVMTGNIIAGDFETIYTGLVIGKNDKGEIIFTDELGAQLVEGNEITLSTVRNYGATKQPSVDIYRAVFHSRNGKYSIEKKSIMMSVPFEK